MNNPFELLDERLSKIEKLLLDLKNEPKVVGHLTEPEKLLNIQEVAEILNLSVPTIYCLVS
jgi:small nuclear ribonucleoprotein (snRNP)-like protein